ncbi:unnamed protein product [Colias eurytheme]|nr:unnamed protein product [Colias eurytheme]
MSQGSMHMHPSTMKNFRPYLGCGRSHHNGVVAIFGNAPVTKENAQIPIGVPIIFEEFPRRLQDPIIRSWPGDNGTN